LILYIRGNGGRICLFLVRWKAAILGAFALKAGLAKAVIEGRAADVMGAAKRRCALHAWRNIVGLMREAILVVLRDY
jgi:hypothetical protein